MGRSAGGGGGSRSGGGRSGGSRSSGRSAGGSFSSGRSGGSNFSSGRSASSSRNTGSSFSSGRSGASNLGTNRGSGLGTPPRGPIPPTGPMIPPRPFVGGGNIFVGGIPTGNANQTNSQPINNNQSTTSQAASGTVPNQSSGTEKKKKGCLSTIITIFIWFTIISILLAIVGGDSDTPALITDSTIERQKLNLNLSDEAGYYTDECGWIRNRTALERGLKDFYESTGILPYIYIIDNVAGDYDPSTQKLEQFAENTYIELFDDEGHALLVFWDYAGAYEYTLWLGEAAAQLMDTEACDILFDYIDYYYYEDVSEEEFFANAFSGAGEHMMQITTSSWGSIILVLVIVAVAFAIYKFWKSKKEKEEERRKRAEEILSTPLEKFGEDGDVIDELEKKYEKEI